jgi:hypothetical protein
MPFVSRQKLSLRVMFSLSRPGCSFLALLVWQSCPILLYQSYPVFPILLVVFSLSRSGLPVMAVLCWIAVLSVLSWVSNPILFCPSCSGFHVLSSHSGHPVLDVSSGHRQIMKDDIIGLQFLYDYTVDSC